MSVPALPASTVILLRTTTDGIEVFLVRRRDTVAFMGGAHVFPGGRVDASDHTDDPDAWCDGAPTAVTRLADVASADALAFYVAAVRELFEEAGVLLARGGRGVPLVIDDHNASRFDRYRRRLIAEETTLRAILDREGLRAALDMLGLVGHWVTPEIEARRFDTRFFLAMAPEGQAAAHDEDETTHGEWLRPLDAIDRSRGGEIALPPPTWTMLRRLSRFSTVAEAWAWAQSCPVPCVQPGFQMLSDGSRLVTLPGDPLCPAVPGFEAEETRFLLQNGRWFPVT